MPSTIAKPKVKDFASYYRGGRDALETAYDVFEKAHNHEAAAEIRVGLGVWDDCILPLLDYFAGLERLLETQ